MYIYNFNDSMNGIPMVNVEMATSSAQVAIVPSTVASASVTNTSNLSVGTISTTGATPLTPEILNSVMAMTNPLEYSFPSSANVSSTSALMTTKSSQSTDSHSSSSGSPFDSPLATTPSGSGGPIVKEVTTPTVQQTCSQLIKTSLKLSLEMKRKMSTSDSSSVDTSICKKIKPDVDTSDDEMLLKPMRSTACLSPEDEDRRRRRRERNKIAATKCRMKKRERTVNLVSEAETLESQNIDLKAQMRSLEIERRSLTEMLQLHANSCTLTEGIQIPNVNAAITKYLIEMGLGNGQTSDGSASASRTLITVKTEPTVKISRHSTKCGMQQRQQKIPSVSTLKFNTRRGQQTNDKLIQSTAILSPVTVVAAVSSVAAAAAASTPSSSSSSTISPSRHCMIDAMSTASPIQECKPLPSIDMGFCEGRNESLTPTSSYCKSLMSTSSDCYAISSPDSGFIKSPVDMANSYPPLPQLMKSDYIPNCDAGLLNDATATGNATNQDNSMEFILKSELVDANDSPYTTVQSADRFLFDGVGETFDPDLDGTAPNSNHISLIEATAAHMHDGLKEHHLLLHGLNNNNNNNSTHINNNHHQQQQHHQQHQQQQHHHHHHHHQHGDNGGNLDPTVTSAMMHDFGVINNLPVISSVLTPPPHIQPSHHSTSIIEFNTACQQYIDTSLLKGDFLSQNCEFLDSQFTTDLDSGVTTYTNSSGCLA